MNTNSIKLCLFLLIFIISSISIFGIASGNLKRGGDITINNFGNITILNDSVWQENNSIVSLRQAASLLNITSDLMFVSGNVSVFDLDIRSPNSLTFDFGAYKISAENFTFPALSKLGMNITGSRRQIVSDSDFQVRHILTNSTAFLSIFNPGVGEFSKASLSIVNDITVGAALTKSSDTFSDPDVFEFNNNGGNFDIIVGAISPTFNQPVRAGEIRIGFYDNFTLTPDLGIKEFVGKDFYLRINHTEGVIIDSNLTVNGTITGQNIVGEMFFPPNGIQIISPTGTGDFMVVEMESGFSNGVFYTTNTLNINRDGTYFSSYTCSVSPLSNRDIQAKVFVNGVDINRTSSQLNINSNNRIISMSGQGYLEGLSINDEVDLRMANLDNNQTFSIISCNFVIKLEVS